MNFSPTAVHYEAGPVDAGMGAKALDKSFSLPLPSDAFWKAHANLLLMRIAAENGFLQDFLENTKACRGAILRDNAAQVPRSPEALLS